MLLLSPGDIKRIVDAAEAAYPREACGLLVGFDRADGDTEVSEVVPSANVAEPARNDRFEIDPAVRFQVQRRLEGGPTAIIGHYHSHPDHTAQPSPTDLAMVWEPELIWVITSVLAGQAVLTTAYRFSAGRFREIGLRTTDWAPDLRRGGRGN